MKSSKSINKKNKTKSKLSKRLFIFGLLTSLVGLAGFLPSAYFWYKNYDNSKALASNTAEVISQPVVVEVPEVITGKPSVLTIDSLSLNLNVADGVMNPKNGQWTLSNDKVHYALMTVQPNDKEGNTLIYGHYRPGVFATLRKIQPDSLVTVKTENNYIFTYKYVGNKVVEPTDTTIFAYQGPPILTLQTCTGAFMQDRQLFTFEFVGVTKNS